MVINEGCGDDGDESAGVVEKTVVLVPKLKFFQKLRNHLAFSVLLFFFQSCILFNVLYNSSHSESMKNSFEKKTL